MDSPKLILVIILTLCLAIAGNCLVLKTGNEVIINEVIDDDLIAIARSVKIAGQVNGDVFAFAQEVTIENIINGSIYTGGAEIKIITENCRSIWAFCGSLQTNSNIENNLLFFGGSLKTNNLNLIKKDLLAFGGKVQLDGRVQGKVKGSMASSINALEVK